MCCRYLPHKRNDPRGVAQSRLEESTATNSMRGHQGRESLCGILSQEVVVKMMHE